MKYIPSQVFYKITFTVFVAGPILPVGVGSVMVINYLQLDERSLNSFPFLDFAQNMILFGCVWFFLALIFVGWKVSHINK